jgi:adenosylhomocysteinase
MIYYIQGAFLMESMIRDIKLAPSGHDKIEWVKNFMPVLNHVDAEYSKTKPFAGKKMVITMHLEAKTAYLGIVLMHAGAELTVTGSNPLSTQDDVAAALAEEGATVLAWHDCTETEYDMFINKALDTQPDMIIDDGGDLVAHLHGDRKELAKKIIGGSEETTTGVIRLHALADAGKLNFPMVAANDAYCKYLFDNRYGTGQSTWDGIMRTTNLVIAGKNVVIAGYGWCGKGAAMRAKGLGAKVIITEVDPIKAIEAVFDGFRVMPMQEAAKIGDIFLTLTGCKDVIRKEHFAVMKNGAVLANSGHFDVEINKIDLMQGAVSKRPVRKNIEEYKQKDGRKLYLLAEGRLVNLAAGDGHPAEIMDLSFGVQFFSALYILRNHQNMENKVYLMPNEINIKLANIKLASLNTDIDKLTQEQHDYLHKA